MNQHHLKFYPIGEQDHWGESYPTYEINSSESQQQNAIDGTNTGVTHHAPIQQDGSLESRNDSSNLRDNNNSNNNIIKNNNSTAPIGKGLQPATTNPALQRFIGHQPSSQRYKRPPGNQLSSKIRSDVKRNRIDSRDRAYRGNLDVDSSPPNEPHHSRQGNRYGRYNQSSSSSPNSKRHQYKRRNDRYDYYDTQQRRR